MHACVENGGKVLIPVFALGRVALSNLLIYLVCLDCYYHNREVHKAASTGSCTCFIVQNGTPIVVQMLCLPFWLNRLSRYEKAQELCILLETYWARNNLKVV